MGNRSVSSRDGRESQRAFIEPLESRRLMSFGGGIEAGDDLAFSGSFTLTTATHASGYPAEWDAVIGQSIGWEALLEDVSVEHLVGHYDPGVTTTQLYAANISIQFTGPAVATEFLNNVVAPGLTKGGIWEGAFREIDPNVGDYIIVGGDNRSAGISMGGSVGGEIRLDSEGRPIVEPGSYTVCINFADFRQFDGSSDTIFSFAADPSGDVMEIRRLDPPPAELLASLTEKTLALGLPDGAETSLLRKLDAAARFIGTDGAAGEVDPHLESFIRGLQHWNERGLITDEERDELIADAEAILASVAADVM